MKKEYIWGLIILILIGAGVLYYKKSPNSPKNQEPKIEIDHTTSRPDISNATFNFEDQDVTLKNGEAETEIPNSNITQSTTLTDKVAYGDLNNDKKEDAAGLFVLEGAGTGIFTYIAAYVSGTVRYNGTNSIFIGDRISPQSISIANGVVTVNYLDRKDSEPFSATPTVPTSKSFVFVNGELKELK